MNIFEKIKKEEGDSPTVYKCPAGKLTIGAGINLEAQEMPQDLRNIWLDRIVARNYGEVRDRLASQYELGLISLDGRIVLVLNDMAYQLGINGLFKFKKMLAAIQAEDYETAADELLNSNYANQTPNRAKRNAYLLRGVHSESTSSN